MHDRSSHIDATNQNTSQVSCQEQNALWSNPLYRRLSEYQKHAWSDRHEKVLLCTWWMARTRGPSDMTPFSVDDIKPCAIFRETHSFGLRDSSCILAIALS